MNKYIGHGKGSQWRIAVVSGKEICNGEVTYEKTSEWFCHFCNLGAAFTCNEIKENPITIGNRSK